MLGFLGLSPYFGAVVDYGATSRHKPQPDPILRALELLGVEPSAAVWYVGDDEADYRAATAAGASFAWASWGYGLRPEGAFVVLKRFDEIEAL